MTFWPRKVPRRSHRANRTWKTSSSGTTTRCPSRACPPTMARLTTRPHRHFPQNQPRTHHPRQSRSHRTSTLRASVQVWATRQRHPEPIRPTTTPSRTPRARTNSTNPGTIRTATCRRRTCRV
uniref:(northern house mosquito) hypothetical protein n=1 Tax=Culex pipiens TaxID=7175 RepID=A0A8D8I745_CULPI